MSDMLFCKKLFHYGRQDARETRKTRLVQMQAILHIQRLVGIVTSIVQELVEYIDDAHTVLALSLIHI